MQGERFANFFPWNFYFSLPNSSLLFIFSHFITSQTNFPDLQSHLRHPKITKLQHPKFSLIFSLPKQQFFKFKKPSPSSKHHRTSSTKIFAYFLISQNNNFQISKTISIIQKSPYFISITQNFLSFSHFPNNKFQISKTISIIQKPPKLHHPKHTFKTHLYQNKSINSINYPQNNFFLFCKKKKINKFTVGIILTAEDLLLRKE